VLEEIDLILERYSEPKVIYFADDNFCTDIKRVEAICRGIIERKSDAYFWCQARVDTLSKSPQLVDLMGEAHFAAVLTGLETPVPRLLRESNKGTTVEQIHQAIEMLHARDIGVWGTFTLGLPGETKEEAEQTGRFITQTNVDIAQITVATPVPGSDLYDQAVKDGAILESDWDKFDFTSPILKGQLPKKELDAIMHHAYLKVYLSPRFLRSLFSKRTNLSRLRRTAVGVFGAWIGFLIKHRISSWIGRKQKMHASQGSAK